MLIISFLLQSKTDILVIGSFLCMFSNRHIKINYKKERRKQIDIFAENSISQKQS